MGMGQVMVQALVIASLPILARLYNPEVFGVWGLAKALGMMAAVILPLAFQNATMLPARDGDSARVAGLTLHLVLAGTALLFVLSIAFSGNLSRYLGVTPGWPWVLGIPFLAGLMAVQALLTEWYSRRQRFVSLPMLHFMATAVRIGLQILAAVSLAAASEGLLAGALVGLIVNIVAMVAMLPQRDRRLLALGILTSRRRLLAMAGRYKDFALYTAPYSIFNAITFNGLIVLIGAFTSVGTVGLFVMARSLTQMPATLIASSLRQVFYAHAARNPSPVSLGPLIARTLLGMALVIPAGFVIFLFTAPQLIGIFLGPDWADTLGYAQALALNASVVVFTGWLDRLYYVFERQKLATGLQITSDIIKLGVVAAALGFGLGPLMAVLIYAVTSALYNVFWLVVTLRIAGLSLLLLIRPAVAAIASAGLTCGLFLILASFFHWAAATAGTLICCFAVAAFVMRKFPMGPRSHRD